MVKETTNPSPLNPPTWAECMVNVADLKPYEKNPRHISEAALARLKASIQELGYHQRILAQPDLRIIGGHQRKKIFTELGWEKIIVLIPSRPLTDEEFTRALVQDNLAFGDFDLGKLKENFDAIKLRDWGLPLDLLAKFDRANDPMKEWKGMPAFKQADQTAFRTITIHFRNEDDLKDFERRIGQDVTDLSISIWHPKNERVSVKGKAYAQPDPIQAALDKANES